MLQTAYLISLALLLALIGMRFRYIRTQLGHWLIAYFAIVFLVELAALYLPQWLSLRSNHAIHNYGMPLYVTAFVLFAAEVHEPNRKAAFWLLGFYYLFALGNLLLGQGSGVFNTYSLMVASCLIVWLTGRYFFSLLQVHDNSPLIKEPLFWINAGFFFFYLCNVFAAGTILYFIKTDAGFARFEIQIIQFLNMLMLLCVAAGILCIKRKPFHKT